MDKVENNELDKVSNSDETKSNFLVKAKDKALGVMDVNNDGKFDLKDISHVAGAAGNVMKKTAGVIKETATEKAKLLELKTLMPIFEDDLDDAEFVLTKLVRICGRDKRRADSEVCQGAIGCYTDQKNYKFVNIYADKLEMIGATFYPDTNSELYYVDPADRDRYIAIDEYFNYLKSARVSELQKIAQDLGAKHFKITYKEEKTSITNKNIKNNVNVTAIGKADIDNNINNGVKECSKVEIAAEMSFPGRTPVKPSLRYLQRDPNIQNLIAMRLDENSPITNQRVSIKMSNTIGIKESDAVKIDAVIKSLKLTGTTTVASEVKSEFGRYLDYEIDF